VGIEDFPRRVTFLAVRRDDIPSSKLHPDILVRRGPVGDRAHVDDPIVIIEIMSSQSKRRDERFKHPIYWNMPTVRHIVLVDAERVAVVHDQQMEEGWDRSMLLDPRAVIDLAGVGFSIALENIYSGVVFGLRR
jgi:Uma2 family endonuclease